MPEAQTVPATTLKNGEDFEFLNDVPFHIEVVLDRRIVRLNEILKLEPGSIIMLDRAAGDNIDIYVNNVLLGFGEIMAIENRMGVCITDFQSQQ